MDARGIESMLSELRATAKVAAGKSAQGSQEAGGVDFAQVLDGALKQTSAQSEQADKMAEAFSSGDQEVNLQDVMINLKKADLSFQQMVQVRNRLVTAYQDVMNMSV